MLKWCGGDRVAEWRWRVLGYGWILSRALEVVVVGVGGGGGDCESGVNVREVNVVDPLFENYYLLGRGIEKGIEGSSKASIPPFGSAKRPRPEVCARVIEMFRTRTVPKCVSIEEGPFDEFPVEIDEEDEDSDMSLQFQRPKGPDVNYVPKNIAKKPYLHFKCCHWTC
ncbi:hypothetical protein Tco_1522327 [Tanacetum coccineum]